MNEIDFINKWSPNGFENPYQNYCFKADLKKFREQIRADAIDEVKKILPQIYCNNCSQIACDGGRVGSIQECASVRLLIDILGELEDELKEQNK